MINNIPRMDFSRFSDEEKAKIRLRCRTLQAELDHLYDELNAQFSDTRLCAYALCETDAEREECLKKLYVEDYTPLKTAAPVAVGKGGECDMTGIYLSYIEGYEKFSKTIKHEYEKSAAKRDKASELYTKILSMPPLFSKIIILTYYYKRSPEDIVDALYISRSSLFRYKKESLIYLAILDLNLNRDVGDKSSDKER